MFRQQIDQAVSHPARGAWIEIRLSVLAFGMPILSHPARGAWIEIIARVMNIMGTASRTPQGVRGLKFFMCCIVGVTLRRTPQGVRGLKFETLCGSLVTGGRTPQGVRGLK